MTTKMQTLSQGVAYPVAYSMAERSIIKIDDAPRKRGEWYSCVHCDQRMSAVVLVTHRTPHFRHIDPEIQCDPDSALHSYAIRMIQQAHATAQKTGSEYMLTRRGIKCESDCQNYVTEINLADGWECGVEKSIVSHTRSDLVFAHPDGPRIVVEVVNTHEMEPETTAAYQRAGVPVAIVRAEWDTIERLLSRLDIHDSQNFDRDICDECEARRRDAEERHEREERERADRLERRTLYVDKVLSLIERRRSSKPLFHPWRYGKHSTEMYPHTRRKVFANAIILTELGFEQHNSRKPWLFRFTIHRKSNVVLYADLGGSDVIPIYEDTAAMLYVFGESLSDDDDNDDGHYGCCRSSPISHYIIEEFGKRLQQFGVDVRTGFLAPENVERVEVDPLKWVDPKQIEKLIAA